MGQYALIQNGDLVNNFILRCLSPLESRAVGVAADYTKGDSQVGQGSVEVEVSSPSFCKTF